MRGKTIRLGDALVSYLRENGLEQPILEKQVVDLWPQVMGETVARLTKSVEMTDGNLVVRVSSAALKAQLFECRFQLIERLNTRVGAKVIRSIRILG